MTDLGTMVNDFFASLARNPVYVFLLLGGLALMIILIVVHHIHKIRSEEIFVHQAWGSNWKGR